MKIVTIVAFLLASITTYAQMDLKKVASTAAAAGFDPAKIGKGIMDSLTPKLGLSADQSNKVSGVVQQFLTKKSGFVAEAKTSPDSYKAKLATEQKTLFDGLKGNLKPEQYTKFLGLKPAQTDTANSLAQLFY
ncbi:hypothetical protein BH09BAC3_BH09BAC3_31520 [soil metagenome]